VTPSTLVLPHNCSPSPSCSSFFTASPLLSSARHSLQRVHSPWTCFCILLTCFSHNRPTVMATTSIPLHCNICPKKPNFSDVSHLLTHIASKGHLSHYYKIKVRSGTEDSSRRIIETYDRWYTEWNVEDLMSERMNQREKRRTRTRTLGRLLRLSGTVTIPNQRMHYSSNKLDLERTTCTTTPNTAKINSQCPRSSPF